MPARILYSLLWSAALPIVLLRLLWRGRRQSGYRHHVMERLGRYETRITRPVIWVHAVSVGETRAAEPLVRALLARWPDHMVLMTHMTPTGRDTSAALFGGEERVASVYLPYDLGWLVKRFLAYFDPRLGIVMETELWPNLLLRCREKGVPVMLANARLSERSAGRYARWPALSGMTLGALDAIGAQTGDDGERLQALGASRVTVTGNIKFDVTPSDRMIELGSRFKAGFGGRRTLLAASTRDGEEALLLDAFEAQAPEDVLLVIVPRHPQRFDEVADIVARQGLRLQRRSSGLPVDASCRVWLGDSMGEMFAYYAAADVALIGGSWLPFGGQNLIEACAVGTPVIIGPHTFNFDQVAQQAVDCGAALRARDIEAGIAAGLELLANEQALETAGTAALKFANAHRGATARTMAMIETQLSGNS